jgi:hypothetical protein
MVRVKYSDELYHHGILGQKWGIRKYQNEDGSLTPEGRKRYGVGERVKKAARRIKYEAEINLGYNKKDKFDSDSISTLSNEVEGLSRLVGRKGIDQKRLQTQIDHRKKELEWFNSRASDRAKKRANKLRVDPTMDTLKAAGNYIIRDNAGKKYTYDEIMNRLGDSKFRKELSMEYNEYLAAVLNKSHK